MFLDPRNVDLLQHHLLEDCYALLPELILCGTIILLLLLRMFRAPQSWHLGAEALTLTLVALAVSFAQWAQSPGAGRDLFGAANSELLSYSGLLRYDNFTIFMRLFLFSVTALTIWLTLLTGVPTKEDSVDFYCLLLGATVGMSLMAQANHLLMVFIAVEMASLPSFALAGFLKGNRLSSEASLKYVVYGGGASGVMLYGISLIAGRFGTGYLPDLALALPSVTRTGVDAVLLLGMLFIFIGLAFKLSAVPFHFWCPDVFEGAAAEVAAFLSVASKGAALALFARLLLVLIGPFPYVVDQPLAAYLIPTLAFFAALTTTFGNLAAYAQTNLKRLLAYSTIAHAGFMMMGLTVLNRDGAAAVLFYLVVYLLTNLGAFAVVAFLRNETGSEDLQSFRGLIYRSPVMVVTLGIFLLSLLGLPPLAGFAAKFQIFRVLFDSAQSHGAFASVLAAAGDPRAASESQLSSVLFGLLVIAGINTVFSLVYYLKVLKVMVIDQPLEAVEGREAAELPVPARSAFYATILAALVLVVGIFWDPLSVWSSRGVEGFPAGAEPLRAAAPVPLPEARGVAP